MSTPESPTLVDVQASEDTRRVPIDKVGVKHIRFPIQVRDRNKTAQHTVGSIDMSVDLPHHFKGTHMSRFMEILNAHAGQISVEELPRILDTMRSRLNAETAHFFVSFPYFLSKKAPVTGAEGVMSFNCSFDASKGATEDFVLSVEVPVTTLCPCSKEIKSPGRRRRSGDR